MKTLDGQMFKVLAGFFFIDYYQIFDLQISMNVPASPVRMEEPVSMMLTVMHVSVALVTEESIANKVRYMNISGLKLAADKTKSNTIKIVYK